MANSLSRARSTKPKTALRSTSRSKAPALTSDALSLSRGSDVTEAAENAADGEYRIDFLAEERARFVQQMLERHLRRALSQIEWFADAGDIGLLALSLREVAKKIDGISDVGSVNEVPDDWGFDTAMGPESWNNDGLKVALGLEANA